MYIGALATKTKMSIKTIRYYEEIALIKPPLRVGKYRKYDDSYIEVLGMINLAKSLGFTLEELKEIAQAKTEHGLVPMDILRRKIDHKRALLKAQIQVLNLKLDGLSELDRHVEQYNQCLLESFSI